MAAMRNKGGVGAVVVTHRLHGTFSISRIMRKKRTFVKEGNWLSEEDTL